MEGSKENQKSYELPRAPTSLLNLTVSEFLQTSCLIAFYFVLLCTVAPGTSQIYIIRVLSQALL